MHQQIESVQETVSSHLNYVSSISISLTAHLSPVQALMPSDAKSEKPSAEKAASSRFQNVPNLFFKSAALHQRKYESCKALVAQAEKVLTCIDRQEANLKRIQTGLLMAKTDVKQGKAQDPNELVSVLNQANDIVRGMQTELQRELRKLDTASADALRACEAYQDSTVVSKLFSASKMTNAISVFIINVKVACSAAAENSSASRDFSR